MLSDDQYYDIKSKIKRIMELGYKNIADYGVIGNGLTLGLIGIDGSVDWMCFPFMDSPSVFAAVLDDKKGGCFSVRPAYGFDSVQNYLPRTNVLQTTFRTSRGEAELIDFMPAGPQVEKNKFFDTMFLRRIRGQRGTMSFIVECSPRFDYGRIQPNWIQTESDLNTARAKEEILQLFSSQAISLKNEHAHLTVEAGQVVWLGLYYGEMRHRLTTKEMEFLLTSTIEYWQQWVLTQETGKYPQGGFWQDTLDRSALAMKLLQFRKTGAIAAAGTCSLPTIIYGERNWDYRFSWIRDTSMTLLALYELGHTQEVSLYFDWLTLILKQGSIEVLEILYRLRRPVPPDGEAELPHLSGYKNSAPVHIGQFNVGQHQHDIYGELMEMIFSMSRIVGKVDPEFWSIVRELVDHVTKIWREKDHGIWELRTGPHHVTHSKLMCWVALDRGIKIAEHYGFPASLDLWRSERKAVKKDLLENGFNANIGSFTQHYDTDALDASVLRIPLVGLLPIEDPRVTKTIDAIEKKLLKNKVVLRYTIDDGLPGQEHGFLICLFWYLSCMVRQKRFEEVESYLRWMPLISNHLGLFGEQYDPRFRQITGNLPQAFSHIGYATVILEYLDLRRKKPSPQPLPLKKRLRLLIVPKTLNTESSEGSSESDLMPDVQVKKMVNLLRGQFYDGHTQRIDYPLIRGSDTYRELELAVAELRHFDTAGLVDDKQKIAFWINVFNALVIHGVIAFGIRTSVKEVPLFFERAQYRIGRNLYTLSDIEHGVLRNNAVPPWRIRQRFRSGDPRLADCVTQIDPRIHFALVCASRTCPPIEVYEAKNVDEQLDTSSKVFINATTRADKNIGQLKVSEIFKWYRSDFPADNEKLIRFVTRYLYEKEIAEWLKKQASRLRLTYLPYDWRLNR
jgi:GH15 family glucan-1,4-alpha-glucosidase